MKVEGVWLIPTCLICLRDDALEFSNARSLAGIRNLYSILRSKKVQQ